MRDDIAAGEGARSRLRRFSIRTVQWVLALALLAPLLVTSQLTGSRLVCDVDGDGDIDSNDVNLIAAARNRPSTGADDPRDPDRDGRVTVVDLRICSQRCTRPNCANNLAPRADAGPDQTVVVGTRAQLSGAASSDPDGDSINYQWTLILKPAGSNAALSADNLVNPTIDIDLPGSYVARLVVSDGKIASASDEVRISTENSRPIARAGPAQSVKVKDTVVLNGSASSDADGDPLTFRWELVARPSGSAAQLSGADAVNPTFLADRPGQYLVELVVNDGKADSAPSQVTVTTENSAPVANAGPDQRIHAGANVQLTGAGSTDVDGDALTYSWTIATKPAGSIAAIPAASNVTPSFTADLPGTYVVQLIVYDGKVNSAPSTVTITSENVAPVANAGPDQTVALSATALLDGCGSSDADGDPLTYTWSLTTRPPGSGATLSNPVTCNPDFTADRPGTYIAQLIVADGYVNSAPDTVSVSTTNSIPIADAGPDKTADKGQAVELEGCNSRDPDGTPLTYAWSFTNRPAGSNASFTDDKQCNPRFTPDLPGPYVAQLIVNDGSANSAPDTVLIAVNDPAPPSAVDDSYSTQQATAFTVAAPGVLTNDSGAAGKTLTAQLVTAPATNQGTATLQPTGGFTFTPTSGFVGAASFTYQASDGTRLSNIATVTITVLAANRAPQITSTPVTGATAGVAYGYPVTATDPDAGDTLVFSLPTAPAGMTINAQTGAIQWTPTVQQVGPHNVTVRATDKGGLFAEQSFVVTVAAPPSNTAPVASADRYSTPEGQTLQTAAPGVLANDRDPDGNPLTAELVGATSNGTLTLQPDGGFRYVPNVGFAGIDRFTYRARDSSLASAPATVEIVVSPDPGVLPLDLDLVIVPPVVAAGGTVTVTVLPRGGRAPVARAATVDGVPLVLDAAGSAIVSGVTAGVHRVSAAVTDALGSVTKLGYFSGQVAGDGTAPTVAISAPANSTELFGSIDVQGTANDANLAEYRLLFAPSGSGQFVEFGRGTSPVVNGTLGRFDVTTLANGLYDIVLEARDANGAGSQALVTVEVVGDQKVGNFQVTFEDLNVDAAGIPIVVTRTYSTARRFERLDFGYGWSVDYQNVKIQTNKALGQDWALSSTGTLIRTWCIRPTGKRTVSVTLPDGRVERFDMAASPECQQIVPPSIVSPVFTPRPGTRSTLTTIDPGLLVAGGHIFDSGTGAPFDPDSFTLTTEDKFVYQLDKNFGIRSVRDPFGNTLTYSAGGIIHSGGQSVSFQRDGQGRITRITDPSGRSIDYAYNANGDLAAATDRGGDTARYRYNRTHGLVDFTDPRGILLVRNVYDDNGKLIEQYDAAGNKVAITSDTANRQQIVRDRRGFTTVYEYDANGNVTRTTDALGGITTSTYDARGNELTITDPLGRTTRRSFNNQDRVLSETDPLGNISSFAYDANGQPVQISDARGNTTALVYSPNGSPAQITDGAGATTSMVYDSGGNLTQLTDPMGGITRYTYDAGGRLIAEVNALGGSTSYTNDANGKEIARSTTRTHNGALVSVTTTRVLDANGQVLRETDASGAVVTNTYNSLGKLASRTDSLKNTTSFEYDSRGHLTAIVYPDSTRETIEYDANGNETARTDRAGRVTSFVYDALNRLVKTTLPDGTELRKAYDGAGQLIEETDARGNRTTYQYDDAGRRIRVVDALGNSTTTAYDAVGNIASITDAAGNTTAYTYDGANRRIRTTFPDATTIGVAYDAAGRKLNETDQAGNTTAFAYDALGRLVTVTDPLGGITRFTYDEVGNKLTQTDALGRVTRWEYDNLGRVTRRTLPNGGSESFTYDGNGNRRTHTDFNGATTRFAYDVNNRLVSKRFADASEVGYTYTSAGLVATVTDNRGVTSHSYDALHRLIQVDNPDGSVLRYAYDAAGNRIELTVQQGARPPRTTRYAYDALNRLTSVTDPEAGVTTYGYSPSGNRSSVVLPNGTRADYTYDALNRLLRLEHRRMGDGVVIARFAYSLAANGQRVQAVETVDGVTRTVNYTYDAYRRLVREQIADPTRGNRDSAYVYDAVGNRLRMTVDGALTTYSYDANDRLVSEATASSTLAYTYDANGNTLTKRRGTTTVAVYTWNFDNRLAGAAEAGRNIAYAYDAEGNRVTKSVDGVISHYVVDSNRQYAEVVEERANNGDLIVGYVHGDDLVKQLRGGQGTYYHADGAGSTRLLTDGAGAVTDTWHYEAFGVELARTGSTQNEYRFTGEQIDPNTGYYYLRARWMNPDNGRFLAMDSFGGVAIQPASLNKYVYADADPVNRQDPSGHFSIGFTGFAGAILSTAIRISTPLVIQGGVRALIGRILIQSAFRAAPAVASVSARQLVAPALVAVAATAIQLCVNSDRCRPSISIYVAGRQTPQTSQHNLDALVGFGSNGSPISPFFLRGPRMPVNYNSLTVPHSPCTPPRSGSCDEYPYATTLQGGEVNWAAGNVSLRVIAGEDGVQGGQISAFYGACGISLGTPFVAFGMPGVPAGYVCSNGRVRLF